MIGLNRAVFLQQIHYWLQKSNHVRDGRTWIYNSYEGWQEQLFFLSVRTIKRMVEELTEEGILIKGCYNVRGYDRTTWYSIDYDRLDAMLKTHEEKRGKQKKAKTQKKHPPEQGSLFAETDMDEAIGAVKQEENSEKESSSLAVPHSAKLAPSIVPSWHHQYQRLHKRIHRRLHRKERTQQRKPIFLPEGILPNQ